MPVNRFAQRQINQSDNLNITRLKKRAQSIQTAADAGLAGMMAGLATKAELTDLANSETAMNAGLVAALNAERAARTYADMQEGQARVTADNANAALVASSIAALNLGTASTKATAFFEPAVSPGTAGQYYRGDKTWRAIAIGEITGLSAALTGLSDAYLAADAVLNTKIEGRLKRVSLGNVTVSWGAALLGLGIRAPIDKAITGIRIDDVLCELRPTSAMPANYAMMQAYIKANGVLTMIFYTPSLTLISPMVDITFEVIVLRSGA